MLVTSESLFILKNILSGSDIVYPSERSSNNPSSDSGTERTICVYSPLPSYTYRK